MPTYRDLFIEPRLLIAYGLLALIVMGVVAAIFYARYHSHRSVYRRQQRIDRERARRRSDD